MTIIDVVSVDQQPDMMNAGINLLDMGHVAVVTKSEHAHIKIGCPKCEDKCIGSKFHSGCRYRTYQEDYSVLNQNTVNETIFIDTSRLDAYRQW